MDVDFYRKKILEKLCQSYKAVYLLFPDDNKCIDYSAQASKKSEESSSDIPHFTRTREPVIYELDEVLCYWIENNVDASYRHLFNDFLGPEKNQHFKNINDETKIVFKSVAGEWFALTFFSFKPEEFFYSFALLVTIKQVSDIQNDFSDIFTVSRNRSPVTENYIQLFLDANSDMYTSVWKVNFSKNELVQITISQDSVKETHIDNLASAYQLLLDKVYPSDKDAFRMKTEPSLLEKLAIGSRLDITYRSLSEDQKYHWYSAKIVISVEKTDFSSVPAENGEGKLVYPSGQSKIATLFISDIDEEIREKQELLRQSEHDELTDLFNRTKLDSMKKTEYAELDSCGIFFLDVNNLKPTNDKYGHEAGDNLLCLAADSIRSLQSRRVHAYRYGGDEFLVIICNGDEEEISSIYRMWATSLESLSRESGIKCSIAVGSAWSEAPVDLDNLIQIADNRMYVNKKRMKMQSGEPSGRQE